jgi:D-alanyl-D-alanine carboxypeptidase (penicillin-binding protein 5/6)
VIPTSRARYRRRRIIVASLLAIVVVLGVYLPTSLLSPLPAAVATVPDVAATTIPPVTLATPTGGSSAIALDGAAGADGVTGSVLGTSGPQTSMPIASMTKTITALVVLSAKPLEGEDQGPGITMTQADVDILNQTIAEDGSWTSVYPGQTLSERQVIEVMLLESANNYSVTLANWAFGSVDAYLAAAQAWIAQQGLTGTTVVDTSGLNPASQSSPPDLLKIGSLVLANPVLASIVSTKSDTLPQIGEIDNTNTLIGIDGIDGVKTGTTDEAGFCLMFSAEQTVAGQNVQLVGVVLGTPSEDALHAAVTALLQSAQAGFQTVPVVHKGDVVGSYTTPWGARSDIVAGADASVTVWSTTTVTRTVTTEPLDGDTAGTPAGTAEFAAQGVTIGDADLSVPLVLASDIAGPDLWWRLGNPARAFG